MKKTIAIGIIALQYEGKLLQRFVGEVGVLPGTNVMVPQDCWCVLVAGDRATAVFDVGPHELQLTQFNRQPSGLLYMVGREAVTVTWYPTGSPYRRSLTYRVGNPLQFVQEWVVVRSAETAEDIGDRIKAHVDGTFAPGRLAADPTGAASALAEALGAVGLVLLDLQETSAVAPEIPQAGAAGPSAGAAAPPPPAGAPAGATAAPPAGPSAGAAAPPPPAGAPAGATAAPPAGPSAGAAAAPPAGPSAGAAAPPPPAGAPAGAAAPPPPAGAPAGATAAPPAGPSAGAAAPPPPAGAPAGAAAAPPPAGAPAGAPVPPPAAGAPAGAAAPPPAAADTPGVPVARSAAAAGSPPASPSPPGAVPSPGVATGPGLRITQVWASSTMDLFGKGELTLRVRLLGRVAEAFDPAGPFAYDQTREYLSPDDWLAERKWQALPEDALVFPALPPQLYYRLYVVAEERDPGGVDPLGSVEVELGRIGSGVLEVGPTRGGKRGQYVKLQVSMG